MSDIILSLCHSSSPKHPRTNYLAYQLTLANGKAANYARVPVRGAEWISVRLVKISVP